MDGAGRDIREPNADAVRCATQGNCEILVIDANAAAQAFAPSTMQIPMMPGPLTFVCPERFRGYHARHNRLENVSQIRLSTNGRSVAWHRDGVISRTRAVFHQNNVNYRHYHLKARVIPLPGWDSSRFITQSICAIPNDTVSECERSGWK